jgi:hypothetical protein
VVIGVVRHIENTLNTKLKLNLLPITLIH